MSRTMPVRKLNTLTVLLVLALSSTTALAQKQYNIWYFGRAHGLDFSTEPPTVLTNGATQTTEGTAVYCDPSSGQLLFYTDGMTVWNRQHSVMPNGQGLISDQSSTQAALILPDPANRFRYYIFHSDHSGYGSGTADGVHYSICDLELGGGLGDIVQKNTHLLSSNKDFRGATEKLTAIPVCNGTAYWIISHEMFNNTFVAWFLDANGLSDPVRTNIGVIHGMSTSAGAGYLVASPDGTMLASVVSSLGSVQLYKFDRATGKLSSPVQLPISVFAYGACFSPSNEKLYVSAANMVTQYDITSWDSTTIAGTRFDWDNFIGFGQAIMQGPDGKLYLQHAQNIGVIGKPDESGDACEYDPLAIPLSGLGSSYGLPNNISVLDGGVCRGPLARIGHHVTNICEERCIDFTDSSRFGAKNYQWTFEGATPSTSTDRNPKNICYNVQGTYTVKLVVWNEHGKDSTTSTIRIKSCPKPEIVLRDTTICISDCITFKDTSSVSTSTVWLFDEGTPSSYNGKTPPQICYYRLGKHRVRVIASNEYGSDTAIAYVTVEDCTLPAASFTHDTVICIGGTVSFTDKSRNTVDSWAWTFEGGTPASSTEKNPQDISFSQAGLYQIRLIVTNKSGSDTAFSTVHVMECLPPVAVLHSYEICQGDCIYLEDSSTNNPTWWEWQLEGITPGTRTTSTPGQICYDTPGRFSVQLISGNAYGADTVRSNVLVRPATGYVRASLTLATPIEACSFIDTAFWVYAGCEDNELTQLRSDNPNILLPSTTVTIRANDSLKIAIRIMATTAGSFSSTISFSLNGEQFSIPCSYTVLPDPEKFVLSASDMEFVTTHCDATSRQLTITNDACSEQEISSIYLDATSGMTPFTVSYDGNTLRLSPEQSINIEISYDPTKAGDIEPDLIIETAKGIKHVCPLRGVRMPLPQMSIGLRSPTHNSIAGDEVGVELAFETAVGDTASPVRVDVTLDYNTDVLSVGDIVPLNGWNLENKNETSGKLLLSFTRMQQTTIAQGEILAQLTFTTYLAKEDSTAVSLSSVVCDPDNAQFATCVLATGFVGSGSVHVGAECGDEMLRETLGKQKPLSVIVQPNPVDSRDGSLTLSITSAFANESIAFELIDLTGKRIELRGHALTSSHEEHTLKLPPLTPGLYTLRAIVGNEQVTRQIVIY